MDETWGPQQVPSNNERRGEANSSRALRPGIFHQLISESAIMRVATQMLTRNSPFKPTGSELQMLGEHPE